MDVNIEELSCSKLDSDKLNKSIRDLNIRKISGANLIGLKTKDNEFIYNPSPDLIITAHDKLFIMGTHEQINLLVNICTKK